MRRKGKSGVGERSERSAQEGAKGPGVTGLSGLHRLPTLLSGPHRLSTLLSRYLVFLALDVSHAHRDLGCPDGRASQTVRERIAACRPPGLPSIAGFKAFCKHRIRAESLSKGLEDCRDKRDGAENNSR